MENIIEIENKEISLKDQFRKEVSVLQETLIKSGNPRIEVPDEGKICVDTVNFPLKHSFSEGVYIREMEMKQGSLVVGHIHKRDHTWFLLRGLLTIATEYGTEDYIGPCYVQAPSGAKRIIYAHEDSIFVNIHLNPTNTKDIDELEKYTYAESYEEYEEWKKENTNEND